MALNDRRAEYGFGYVSTLRVLAWYRYRVIRSQGGMQACPHHFLRTSGQRVPQMNFQARKRHRLKHNKPLISTSHSHY